MFMSLHTKDQVGAKIEVELMEDGDFAGINEFERHPVCMVMGDFVAYLRPEEAHKLAVNLNNVLQELDRRRIQAWKKGV
jgi:hypothetical protein